MTGLKPEQSLKDGSRLELSVQVKGDPDPMVTWLKDGKQIASNEIMEVKYKNGTASVIINEVFPEDGGKYTCKATNSKGSVETSSKVSIIPMEKKANGVNGITPSGPLAPRVLKHVVSSAVKDGEAVTLNCTLGGADKYDVLWLHNEKEIKPSKDFEYKSPGRLTVSSLMKYSPKTPVATLVRLSMMSVNVSPPAPWWWRSLGRRFTLLASPPSPPP